MVLTQAFYPAKLAPVSVWDKVTGQKHRQNALIEINNLLAERPLLEVQGADVQAILDRYNLNLFRDFTDGSLRDLYKKYLRYCFDDNHLNDEETRRLRHLKRLLGLSDKDVALANHQICQEVYARSLDEAREDQRLHPKELNFLHQLRYCVQLPPTLENQVQQSKAADLIIRFIKGEVTEQPLSTDEEEELTVLTEHLNAVPQWQERTRVELVKYRLHWQIENEALPHIFVPLPLRPQETCHFLCDAIRQEATHQEALGAESHRPSSDALRRKLANRAYWRNARAGTIHLANDAWRSSEPGKLYLTNQRLIFRNPEVEMVVYLDSIADFDHYRNGIFVHPTKGLPLFFATPSGADIASMILGRILRER
jgi:hypothetical protein